MRAAGAAGTVKRHMPERLSNHVTLEQPELQLGEGPDRTFRLVASMEIPHRPPEVFEFFADAYRLEVITPPFLRFHVLTPPPIHMEVGTRIDYRLRVRGLPLRWTSEITAWEPPVRFVDEQVRGPYRLWVHEHRFTSTTPGTLIEDDVCYSMPGGAAANQVIVARDLRAIFEYRRSRLQELMAARGRDPGASVSRSR